jgi:hypothetical protein
MEGDAARSETEDLAVGQYVLRKVLGAWSLVFGGRGAPLPERKAVAYVLILLMRPGELVHGAELAHRAFGDAVVQGELNLALDDYDRVRWLGDSRRRCQAVVDDPNANETEKEEARAELEGIEDWARRHLRGTEGNEQRQVRAVRQAIRRFLDELRQSPDETLRAFGEHLEAYLWRPSGRGSAGRNLRVRAGLAGRFVYEPPEGVRWVLADCHQ